MTATHLARETKTVLIVDDDSAVVRMLKDALGVFRHTHAYKVEIAKDGADALAALQRDRYDLVLLDMYMPRMTGLELLERMRELQIQTPVLMLTGNENTRSAADALASGIFAYIPKPFELQHLEHLVWLAVSSRAGDAS
jgi:two-component system, NtrC family, nitrogen regulation response regulator NtrX